MVVRKIANKIDKETSCEICYYKLTKWLQSEYPEIFDEYNSLHKGATNFIFT